MTTQRRKTLTTPTDASAWGVAEPGLYELPSGKTMRLRPGPCMNRLMREGVIPNPLLGAVVELADDGESVKSSIDWKQREEHRAAIVCAMAVDPPVTMEPLEGAVLYDALDERDAEFIVVTAQEGVPSLARFRDE